MPKTLENFVKYCHRYDPTISVSSGHKLDCSVDDYYPEYYGYSKDYIPVEEFNFYFSCLAKQYLQANLSEVIQHIHKYSDGGPMRIGSEPSLDELNQIVNPYNRYKQYIYYESDTQGNGWIVVRRRISKNGEFIDRVPEEMIFYFRGVGKTLVEADKNLVENYAAYLEDREKTIQFLLTRQLPLTLAEFIDICQSHDKTFNGSAQKTLLLKKMQLINLIIIRDLKT